MWSALAMPSSMADKCHGIYAGRLSVTKASNNNRSYCRGELYELQGGHLQATVGSDEAPGSTPHGYIAKSSRLGRGMGASATTRCNDLINESGSNLNKVCMQAWMAMQSIGTNTLGPSGCMRDCDYTSYTCCTLAGSLEGPSRRRLQPYIGF